MTKEYYYINSYCNRNFGDDMFIISLIKRYPNASFYVCASKSILPKLNNYSNIKFDDSKIIFAGKRFGCDDEVFDVSLISLDRKDEILKSIKINGPEDILNFSNPCSSVDFSPRSEILGFKVSEKNIERYGKVVVAAAIFESLVSFCIDEDDRSERIEDITESLCRNVDVGETVDMETLREELGFEDNRSNIEKLREQYTNLFSSYVDVTDYILDIEEVLIEEGIIDDNFNKV